MDPRKSRADQFVIDLLRNRAFADVDLLPARFEFREILVPLVDAFPRPIAHSARTLDPIYIIARERRIFRAPGPEIVGKFIENVRAGAARLRLRGGDTQ